jgi:hypothetical protein
MQRDGIYKIKIIYKAYKLDSLQDLSFRQYNSKNLAQQ